VFGHCDIGIVGDWHEVLPVLVVALRRERDREVVGRR
jgi:electron transfer flavoprotein alpha subunit